MTGTPQPRTLRKPELSASSPARHGPRLSVLNRWRLAVLATSLATIITAAELPR
ncbi:hypothetical protein ABT160_28535 [Streptomyces sp. NPDC001941]|uniref:hypothetical protein n=1 Tax=Streptomyces sp. NPDC001941 TaxID=3154659 RepID=UPI003330DA85